MSAADVSGDRARHAVIVGGSTGIGFAIAEAFIDDGCEVSLIAHDTGVHEAAKELTAVAGGVVRGSYVADIADHAQVAAAFDKIGSIDVLVCNAGIEPITPLDDSGDAIALFRRVIDVNLIGQHFCTLAALKHMSAGGALIYTSSIWGKIGVTNYSAYCASKHGVLGYVRALSRELGPRGISVNAVCPGQVLTQSVLNAFDDEAALLERPAASLIAAARQQQAFDADLSPSDVARAYVFLARNSRSITGQALTVDMGGIQV